MLELLTAFAKYVGGFINAAMTKLKKEIDDKFVETVKDYDNKITESYNLSSRPITFKNSNEQLARTIESILVNADSKIEATLDGKTIKLNTKRLITVVEDDNGNKLNIAESGVKFKPSRNIEISLDPTSKEMSIGVKNDSFIYESPDISIKHIVTHNLNSYNLDLSILSKNLDGTYSPIYAGIVMNSENQITINLTEGTSILCMIKRIS